MRTLRRGWSRFVGAFTGRRKDSEFADEFAGHIDLLTQENIRAGMDPVEARRQAVLKFGTISSAEEACREQRGLPRLEAFAIDMRHASRALRKSPGFALTIILTLAIAIGANTAIFSLVNQALLHPRGVDHPERIVSIRERYGKLKMNSIPISGPAFRDVRDNRELFEYTAALDGADFTYTGSGSPQHLRAASVTKEWFQVFGAKPLLGRIFVEEEDQPKGGRVVVLSYTTWTKIFGADPNVIHRTIELDHLPFRVIGVMGSEFNWPRNWPREIALWIPLALGADAFTEENRFNESFSTMARLREGVTPEQANAWLKLHAAHVLESNAPGATEVATLDWGMFSESFTQVTAGETRTPMLMLMAAVGIVLLIASSNIAGLMIARNAARSHELAVQAALGASRARLLSRTCAESLLLTAMGTITGIALAFAGMKALLLLAPGDAIPGLGAQFDFTTFAFTVAISMTAGVFFGVLPSWRASMVTPFSAMKGAGRVTAKQRFRSTLVVMEAALALVLMIAAGALLRSFRNLERVHPGFDAQGITTASISFPEAHYSSMEKQRIFFREVLQRLPANSGIAVGVPFSSYQNASSFSIEGQSNHEVLPHADTRVVSPGYIEALRIPLKRGRLFAATDHVQAPLVAVIDETLAKQYWPNEDPVGKRIQPSMDGGPWVTIAGVVGHVLETDLAMDSGRGMIYYSVFQYPLRVPFGTVVTAASDDAVRAAVAAVDPEQPLFDVQSLGDRVSASLASRKFVLRMMTVFATIALFLSAIGLFGVINYAVTQRNREIGIRMALGARRSGVYGMILKDGLRLAFIGSVIGLAVAAALAQTIESQLFQVRVFDPTTVAGTLSVLLAVTIGACFLPATRAASVDPASALRSE